MGMIRELFALPIVRRITVLLILVLILFSIRDMLNMLLLLFLVTYVMDRLQGYLNSKISKVIRIHPNVISILLYLLIVAGMIVGISRYVPQIVNQIVELTNNIINFLNSHKDNNEIAARLTDALDEIKYENYVEQALEYIKKLGELLEVVLIVILLSLFFLLQKKQVALFTRKFKASKIGWLVDELEYFGKKFTSSFGKVIEVQLMIALFNTAMTMIGLWILGFPYLFALGVMVLILSLIPVAGVIISFIPITLIGYQAGGWTLVIWTVVMILIIHAMETYLLNPRLMAHKTKLPMFYTFVVLVFSQHFFGIWGLIIGIPIFMFLLDILEVNASEHTPSPAPAQTEEASREE
ncbi:AI-2E family transporter [Cohnella lubricantis]|uniref:AI-2E family transporter n=1 Tax=Cohnella lubricantis TaxID=2163172 RepID=A0A841TAK9_9BACL|nr:AI-2E family transporter [Cohnella lubricantis]MBB6677065.1 AI-2E family transporter [Cohnella lubricantis]MBP2118912.1 putative PurR-regulated permease PerM [Cohnella lubricantis]